jgi:multiple sugar transport system ATP-binding protein
VSSITMRGITKRYADGTEAVKNVDLDIADGEFVILVGPSGCGKSTLLRMIVGLEDISDGQMLIGDEVVNDRAPKDRDLAMVFQNYALYPHLSVRENMAFPLRLAKVPDAEITQRVEDAAQVLELTENLDRKPANLSGGQRQRVAMGRAIVRDPKAFLFDEPLSNLDANLRVQMRTEISRIQKKYGTTTVYVTHDQTEAMTLADRVAVLRKGVVQQVDSPRNLYNSPANLFVAGFIGSPSMNLVPGQLTGTSLSLPFGTFDLPADVAKRLGTPSSEERQVIVGIRPEHFEDAGLPQPDRQHRVVGLGAVRLPALLRRECDRSTIGPARRRSRPGAVQRRREPAGHAVGRSQPGPGGAGRRALARCAPAPPVRPGDRGVPRPTPTRLTSIPPPVTRSTQLQAGNDGVVPPMCPQHQIAVLCKTQVHLRVLRPVSRVQACLA